MLGLFGVECWSSLLVILVSQWVLNLLILSRMGFLIGSTRSLWGWKVSTLSQVGKCLLVKSTLQKLLMYALSLFWIPVKFSNKMEKIQRDFLWSSLKDHKRYSLVAWDNLFLPKSYEVLGIRKVRHLNKALLAKQIWHIFNSTGEWRDILINKYVRRPTL